MWNREEQDRKDRNKNKTAFFEYIFLHSFSFKKKNPYFKIIIRWNNRFWNKSVEFSVLKKIIDLQKIVKVVQKISVYPPPSFSYGNDLHNHGIFIKTKKLIFVHYLITYSLDSNFEFS